MSSIGEILADARRARKKTIKEAESMTNIRSRYLSALESNKFDLIPGHIYVKGFIRTYAEYLGIDYIPLIETYKKEYEDVYENKTKQEKSTSFYHEKPKSGPVIKIALIILVIFIVLYIIWSLGRRSGSEENVPKIITETKEEADVKQKTPTTKEMENFKTNETIDQTSTTENSGPITIQLEVYNQRSYIEVTVDGKMLFADVVEAGDSQEFQGTNEIKVMSAHADSVKIIKNGTDLGFMGQSGDMAERTYTSVDGE